MKIPDFLRTDVVVSTESLLNIHSFIYKHLEKERGRKGNREGEVIGWLDFITICRLSVPLGSARSFYSNPLNKERNFEVLKYAGVINSTLFFCLVTLLCL